MKRKGQAVLEFILLVVMLSVTMAVVIRNTNFTIYCFWTGLASTISLPCPSCKSDTKPPQAEECVAN